MWRLWRRHHEPDPQARKAIDIADRKLDDLRGQQRYVDSVSRRVADLGRPDRLAAAVEAAIARRHR